MYGVIQSQLADIDLFSVILAIVCLHKTVFRRFMCNGFSSLSSVNMI